MGAPAFHLSVTFTFLRPSHAQLLALGVVWVGMFGGLVGWLLRPRVEELEAPRVPWFRYSDWEDKS